MERQYPIKRQFNMRADFYIPSIDMIVEWNGVQHYEPVELWGGSKAFDRQQRRDADMVKYCEETGMKLCVIDARAFISKRKPPTEDFVIHAIWQTL